MTDLSGQIEPAATAGTQRLADRIPARHVPSFAESFPPASLVRLGVIAALFAGLNAWQFPGLIRAWLDDANASHGLLIPLFSAYLIYARRDDLLAARRRSCPWALPLVLLALAAIALGFYPLRMRLICQGAMVFLMFALVLYLAGAAVARTLALPIFFLLFALPVPDMLYSRVASPLQELAAGGAAGVLRLFGVTISAGASSLSVTSLSGRAYTLTVAEACAGMRLLTAFVALGVATAYLEDRPVWQRLVLVAAAVPIAVLCNVARVAVTCSMYVWDHPELGQGFMHGFTGMVMLVPALLLLWLLGLLLGRLFVDVDGAAAARPRERAVSA
jgi:exosortase